jgi:proline dehydrogenase
VLKSYLYRTPDDLADLIPLNPNLRLVKGAYLEPHAIAYPHKADVDRAYVTLAERMLREIAFTAIATHDERIIEARRGLRRSPWDRQGPLRVPDALWHPAATAAGDGRPRLSRLDRDAVWT